MGRGRAKGCRNYPRRNRRMNNKLSHNLRFQTCLVCRHLFKLSEPVCPRCDATQTIVDVLESADG